MGLQQGSEEPQQGSQGERVGGTGLELVPCWLNITVL